MLQFTESPPPDDLHRFRRRENQFWRMLLMLAAIVSIVAATQPWTRVEFVIQFGEVYAQPAWQATTAGFTCLCTPALIAVITLVETRTRTARQAVRPASMILAVIMSLSLAAHILRGPGTLRGVGAIWTPSLMVNAASCLALLLACATRLSTIKTKNSQQGPGSTP